MICFRDMTFCSADCKTDACFRHWDKDKAEEARQWWGGEDAPVAFADFSGECHSFIRRALDGPEGI